MALKEHLEASDFIKNVHADLRKMSKTIGINEAWKNHCTNKETLDKYSLAMKELATKYWKNPSSNSRISWVHEACINYFERDMFIARNKELEIADKLNICINTKYDDFTGKWKMLDVGSCYNPFKQFIEFNVTAIDISPAVNTVNKCDFLSIKYGPFCFEGEEITRLPRDHFDVIVFSLLLEYLPSPQQRQLSCQKAFNLLKTEGILVIITPDSNHLGRNAKYIKSWRFVLADMGFSRMKYEKLEHLHCMVFRKSFDVRIPARWANIHRKEQAFAEIFIPQDFNSNCNKTELASESNTIVNEEDIRSFCKELPFDNFD
ncbi:unnamed protein product [Phyllotreta striolata]|uniref:S-adenosylmethionine sensor upstream of mTORC1 n=1 Tax=Phyllotreta striolata TaxID=444603 RepID=A0A9N9XPR0_PHYSR|nr:unnamed protein product [Phyllotreta striolata]